MSRYIDADNILYKDLSEGRGVCLVAFKDWIDKMPSADVVEVVRCKDCRYWNHKTDLTYCEKKSWLGTDAEDYCSFGKRAEK